ncbi:hypothetical protein F511_32319 [Dorcoceras hygrometricum]|uniref:Uncharacterized protein n=1 Tax=Dorcoceras hygrometricum TaxID=472368 RepID=A0A2Z7D1V9_9LAMI|nr:hypothetical protein F511_32319 [Dorcoceras hygrometricum]
MKENHHSDDMNHRMPREFQKYENYLPRLLPTNTRKEHDYLKKYKPKRKVRRVKVAEHHNRPRFILPSSNGVDKVWKLARHRKLPKSLIRTQQRRMLRERASAKREFTGAVVSKSKFCRKATEDKSSDDSDDLSGEDDIQGNETIDFHVGKFHISVDCNTGVVILPEKFIWSRDEENGMNHGSEKIDKKEITVDNRQSGPRPEPRLLSQAALEALTNSARTDSPRRIGRGGGMLGLG